MKSLVVFFLFLFCSRSNIGQNSEFIYLGRTGPSLEKEKLSEARYVSDLMPEFERYLNMPFEKLQKLKNLKKNDYPQEYFQPSDNYDNLIEYLSFDLSVNRQGKEISASNSGKMLSAEQKKLINQADVGTDVRIRIRFKFKDQNTSENADFFEEGIYMATLVPAKEAEFPGGNKGFSRYMTENIYAKISGKKALGQLSQAMVQFCIDENGQVTDPKLIRKTENEQLNRLIISSVKDMPKWKPAQNSQGGKIKQTFSIPFGGGC